MFKTPFSFEHETKFVWQPIVSSGLGGLDSNSEALDPGRASTAPSGRTARSGRVFIGDKNVKGLTTTLELGTPLEKGATRSSQRHAVDCDNVTISPRNQALSFFVAVAQVLFD